MPLAAALYILNTLMKLINTPEDIAAMQLAADIVVRTLDFISSSIRPGISTDEINDLCHNYMVNTEGVVPASLGYMGFPKSICTSVNNVVCHGIPNSDKTLSSGDIINVDVAIIKDGYYGDSSRMFYVGKVNPFAKRLVEETRQALYAGIRQVKAGNHLGDVGEAIQNYAEKAGFSVVRDYCGHGIGKDFHCEPQVLHYGKKGTGVKLQEGMCFTIEPMINSGDYATRILSDDWTVVTQDNGLSAQWEHTVLITAVGNCQVLTKSANEKIF